MIGGVQIDVVTVPVIGTIAPIMITEIAGIEMSLTAPYQMLILPGRCHHLPMLVAITSIDQLHLHLVLVLIHPRDFPWMNVLKESMVSRWKMNRMILLVHLHCLVQVNWDLHILHMVNINSIHSISNIHSIHIINNIHSILSIILIVS